VEPALMHDGIGCHTVGRFASATREGGKGSQGSVTKRGLDLSQDLTPQPRHELLHHLLVRRGQPAGFGRRCLVAGLVLDVFHHVDQQT